MKFTKTIAVALLAASICTAAAGCGKAPDAKSESPAVSEEMMSKKTFKAEDVLFRVMDKYDFPFMGLSFTLPESVMKKMDDMSLAMLCDEQLNDDGSHRLAMLTWNEMTDEQKNTEISAMGSGYFDWEKSLERVGALGMYSSDMTEKELGEVTRCDKHEQIGQSGDGKYRYYLSTNSAADPADVEEIKSIAAAVRERTEMTTPASAFMQPEDVSAKDGVSSIAPLSAETIDGKKFSDKDFADYDLTMVNVFATWCTACVQEIPDIQKLYSEMKTRGVNVVGIVTDTVKQTGSETVDDEDIIALAKKIQEKTKAEYPFLKPDSTGLNGRLNGIDAFPETFFVDKNGNIVGETYTGSHSYEGWKEIVQNVLEEVKGK